jgi:hypothetical protein
VDGIEPDMALNGVVLNVVMAKIDLLEKIKRTISTPRDTDDDIFDDIMSWQRGVLREFLAF